MANVSKPLLGLLAASVIALALMLVVFKGSSGGAGGQSGVDQSAINKAHQAVVTSNAANAHLGAPTATTPAAGTHATAPAHPASSGPTSGHKPASAPSTARPAPALPNTPPQVGQVEAALSQHKVIGLLFYNPAASDDAAVATELAAAQVAPGVVKIAVPVSEVSQFPMVTATVPVTSSPTLLLINSAGDATPLAGFADRFEIAQRLNALAAQ
jgi:hypothetical protein